MTTRPYTLECLQRHEIWAIIVPAHQGATGSIPPYVLHRPQHLLAGRHDLRRDGRLGVSYDLAQPALGELAPACPVARSVWFSSSFLTLTP